MQANAWMFEVLRYAGASYLLFLALKSLRSALGKHAPAKTRAHGGGMAQVFAKGALIHLTNPKAILSWASIYTLVLPAGASTGQVFGLFAFLYSGSILIFPGYALLFSTPGVTAAYARLRRWFELAFAGFFGFASLKVLTARLGEAT
jgi:threonine/homoserine/homoserine lactone efflux protein